jgi:predicted N-acyltransferase
MQLHILEGLEAVNPEQWNRVAGENPFLRHEFLAALERTGCVGPDTGWEPRHLALYADDAGRTELVGAMPLYLKYHSYGEYIFDWSWADAYTRSGRAYYPKLVAAVPFTPATGPRLLVADNVDRSQAMRELVAGAREVADRHRASSLHWLFHTAAESDMLADHGMLSRVGCQFHWSNPGYRDFDDFVGTFKSNKRNSIRRERRRVRDAGVDFEVLEGETVTPELWDAFYRFYRATIRAHGGMPYLTRAFFHTVGRAMAAYVRLIVGREGGEPVAMALCFHGGDTLYGRYWGGQPEIRDLHFETCYYTPIEYCIARGISRCEAGAQGEHKIARGFAPVQTHSSHWLRDTDFRRAVADFLAREQNHVEYYMDELNEHSPFRRRDMPSLGTAE